MRLSVVVPLGPDEVRAVNVKLLVDEGHLSRVLLSGDCCMKSHMHAFGGKGYDHVPRKFLPLLKQAGISDADIHVITVENPARALDVVVN